MGGTLYDGEIVNRNFYVGILESFDLYDGTIANGNLYAGSIQSHSLYDGSLAIQA